MKKSIITILIAAVVGGITAYAVAKNAVPQQTMSVSVPSSDGKSVNTVNLNVSDYPDFTYAAETAVNAVVYVKVTVQTQYIQGPSSIFDLFGFFGGIPGQGGVRPQMREQVGSGSGVIIRPDGYIVTNNHVVANASKIEVTLNNNKTYSASLVGADAPTDVAIIKINETDLPSIPFADSDKLRLGEWVLAIGSPYDLRSTITAGIVSAKGRSMPNYSNELKIESFIQTDAAVNPGNSGGALVNKAGQLVGVNTAIISQTGSYAGYSFAIPSNIVSKIAEDLIEYGSVKRAFLGVRVSEIDTQKADELKLSAPKGVYIVEVMKASPADKAGMRSGDVLLSIDSTAVNTFPQLQEALSKFRPGDEVVAVVLRDGKERKMNIVFQSSNVDNGAKVTGGVAYFGATLSEMSKDELAAFGLKSGVKVAAISSGKLASAGVPEGFIITYVNDEAVSSAQDVLRLTKKSKRAVYLYGVLPDGRTATFSFIL